MHYEPETYYRERPDADKITHLPSGVIYETMADACRAAGVSPYIMRKLIADGEAWFRPGGSRNVRKKVRCLETGTVYDSVTEAAIANRTTVRIVQKSKLFEYTGEYTPPKPKRRKSKKDKLETLIGDDKGGAYTVQQLSVMSGLVRERIKKLVRMDPQRIFRTAWINDKDFRTARHDGKWYWINGTVPVSTLSQFKTVLRMMGKRATDEEARNMVGDLFK